MNAKQILLAEITKLLADASLDDLGAIHDTLAGSGSTKSPSAPKAPKARRKKRGPAKATDKLIAFAKRAVKRPKAMAADLATGKDGLSIARAKLALDRALSAGLLAKGARGWIAGPNMPK